MADSTTLDPEPSWTPGTGAPPTTLDQAAAEAAPTTLDDGSSEAPSPASQPWVATRLPPDLARRYRLVEPLGDGSEAHVWRAASLAGGPDVALKVFHRPPTYRYALDGEIARHFRPEHAVQTLERGEELGLHYEVMEYCAYGTLKELRPAGTRWSPAELRPVVAELAEALGAMRPLVHGDVKPTNILVRRREPLDLVLSDFGLTVHLGDRSRLTNTGRGTLAYLPPGGESSIRVENDWWALGMIVLELALGRHVFEIEPGEWLSDPIIRDRLANKPVDLTGVTDDRLRLLLSGLLQRDREKRWTYEQVSDWLAGGSPAVAADEGHFADSVDSTPFFFEGIAYYRPVELGRAIRASSAPEHVAKGAELTELVEWAERHRLDERVTRVTRHSRELGPRLTMDLVAAVLDPEGPPAYRGVDLSRTAEVMAAVDNQAWLTDLYQLRPLRHFGRLLNEETLGIVDDHWHRLVDQAREVLGRRAAEAEPLLLRLGLLAALDGRGPQSFLEAQTASLDDQELDQVDWYRELPVAREPAHALARLASAPAARGQRDAERARQAAEQEREQQRQREVRQGRIAEIERRLATGRLQAPRPWPFVKWLAGRWLLTVGGAAALGLALWMAQLIALSLAGVSEALPPLAQEFLSANPAWAGPAPSTLRGWLDPLAGLVLWVWLTLGGLQIFVGSIMKRFLTDFLGTPRRRVISQLTFVGVTVWLLNLPSLLDSFSMDPRSPMLVAAVTVYVGAMVLDHLAFSQRWASIREREVLRQELRTLRAQS